MIKHFADRVEYEAAGFLEKNRDTVMEEQVQHDPTFLFVYSLWVLKQASNILLLREIFVCVDVCVCLWPWQQLSAWIDFNVLIHTASWA